MVKALRFAANVILAFLLVIVSIGLLAVGYAVAVSNSWEYAGLAEGVQGGHWLWLEGDPIYYREWGATDAPPIVLVHGFQVEGSLTWQMNVQALADAGLHVVVVDLRGFGHSVRDLRPVYTLRSQALLLARVLNRLHVYDATVVGYGWGAAVALQLLEEQPQFVERLILVSPQLTNRVTLPWETFRRIPYVGRAAIWLWGSGGPLWQREERNKFSDPLVVPGEYWDELRAFTHIVGTQGALEAMSRSPEDGDLPSLLDRVQVPVLVIVGRSDQAVRTELAELRKRIPDAQVVQISEAGPHVHIEQRSQVNRQISSFALRSAAVP